jgi:eukaryotic-like serine/threonine-protein kinase
MRNSLTFGSFEFDPYSRLLKRDGVELQLPPRVLGVLEVLLRRAGDVVPRQELIDNVWKDAFVTDTSLAEAVSVLRQALGDDPQSPSFIQTFHRRGYRFVAPVAELDPAPSPLPEVDAGVPRSVEPDGPEVGGPSIGMQLVPWSVAAACAILATVAVSQAVSNGAPPARPVTRFTIAPPAGMRFDSRAPAFALSSDGSRIAFSACGTDTCALYLRASDRLEASPLAGTADAAAPFFSPDGRWIGFFADGHVKKVSVNGGAPVTLAEAADPLGGTWTMHGQIVYAGAAPGLRVISESGGEPATLTTPNQQAGEVRHAYPSVVHGTRFLLFTIAPSPDLAHGRIALLDLNTRSRPPIALLANAIAAAAPSRDTLAFANGSELQVVGLDLERGRIAGAPQTAVAKLATANGAPQFAASADGTAIVLTAEPAASPMLVWSEPKIIWTEGVGQRVHEEAVALDDIRRVVLSPDGRRVAGFSRQDAANSDLWIGDLVSGTAARMTHDEVAAAPVWNRNGTAVWFAASSGGVFGIHQREVDSLQPARRVYSGNHHAFPSSVSPDGSVLALTVVDPETGADIWALPTGGGTPRELIRTPFEEVNGVFSPNGQLLAYQSNDAGRWEIHIHRLNDHRRVSVSANGGTSPFWSPYGDALFFLSGNRLMRAAVGADGSIAGPRPWWQRGDARPVGVDLRRWVLFEHESTRPVDLGILTLQWDREVRQLLGPPSPALPR